MIRLTNVVIKLSGGLGNRLFQHATDRALAIEHSRDLVVDPHWYHGHAGRLDAASRAAVAAAC